MKLPFLMRRASVSDALELLGGMPVVPCSPLAYESLSDYDCYPPTPCGFENMAMGVGLYFFNSALRDRCLSSYCEMVNPRSRP